MAAICCPPAAGREPGGGEAGMGGIKGLETAASPGPPLCLIGLAPYEVGSGELPFSLPGEAPCRSMSERRDRSSGGNLWGTMSFT